MLAVLYQILNKQAPVQVPVPNLQVPVPVNYRHTAAAQSESCGIFQF